MEVCGNGETITRRTTLQYIVNMMSVRLLLAITKIFKLGSKVIDFVLAFPQADLGVDIWMYLSIGFEVDRETEEDSKRSYVLELNKSLYVLKQASFNWNEKTQDWASGQEFHPITN